MTLELRIRIKRLSNDRGGGEEASPRQSAATAARNRAACSITLSIRDIGRGTRLRGAMHAEVHASRALLHDSGQSHARRPSRDGWGAMMILAPLNSILEELRELRGWMKKSRGDRIAGSSFFVSKSKEERRVRQRMEGYIKGGV